MDKRQVLDSWKEIAAYVKKGEKTCRRWEKELGLPVHRLEHSPRARVFAYRDEIDLWIEKTGSLGVPTDGKKIRPIRSAGWKWRLIFGATALCALLVLLFFWLRQPPTFAPIESIAILPLQDLSPERDQEWFADGMTEELITQLSQISGLRRVTSRTSIMAYKDARKPLPEIAKELNVDVIGEGSVLREGDRVRITIQLIDARKDKNIWADDYERHLGEVMVLQKEVAQSIAHQIDLILKPEEEARLASKQLVNPRAFDAFLKGTFHREKMTAKDLALAKRYFEEAIEIDPNFAQPYLGLALLFDVLSLITNVPPEEAFPKARAAAEKALELNGALGEAHAALAWALAMYDWDWAGADQAYRRALELQPGSSTIRQNYGWFLSWMGRHDEAIAESQRTVELDPYGVRPIANLSMVLSMARRFDDALEAAKSAIKTDPIYYLGYQRLGEAYKGKEMYGEAIAALQRSVELSSGALICKSCLGHAYALAGREDEAMKVLNELLDLSHQGPVSSEHIAWVYTGLGEKDKALQWLEWACEARDPNMVMLKVWPVWDPLRGDPRFVALLKRMRLD